MKNLDAVKSQVDRSQIWRSLIYHVKLGRLSPVAYIDMVIAFLGKEREQATVTKVLTAAADMLELFVTDEAVEKRYFEFLVSMAAGIEETSLRGIVVN